MNNLRATSVIGVSVVVGLAIGFSFQSRAQTETVLDSTETVSISSMDSPATPAVHGTTVFRLTDYLQRGRLAPPYPWNPFPQCPVYLVNRELNVLLVDDRALDPSRVAEERELDAALRVLEAEYGLVSPPLAADEDLAGALAALQDYYDSWTAAASTPALMTLDGSTPMGEGDGPIILGSESYSSNTL
jgi:hypothetical protein